jgi:hypothetical protein
MRFVAWWVCRASRKASTGRRWRSITIKQGKTRIESKCAKCGALNRVSAAQGQVPVPYTCKECWRKTKDILRRLTRGLSSREIEPYRAVGDLFSYLAVANGSDAHTGVARINVKDTRFGLS